MPPVEDLGQEIADLAARLDAATHRLLECIRRFDESGEWYAQGAVSCAHWLAWRIGLDLSTARERVRVARALGSLRKIDQALSVGKLSYAKVRALTRVATPGTEAKLLEVAFVATGAQLERICRGYRRATAEDYQPAPEERSVRRRELPGGMVKLEVVLSPDEADLVLRAIDGAREAGGRREQGAAGEREPGPVAVDVSAERSVSAEGSNGDDAHRPGEAAQPARTGACEDDLVGNPRSGWPSRADGMVALAEGFLAGHAARGNGGDRFQVMVHLDQDPLAPDGVLAATLEDGTRISSETFRRVACDCGLVATNGQQGDSLNVGRRTRSIPPAIRRALLLRDHGCRFPGCTHDRFLHAHHVQHWLHGGETSVSNLVTLCSFHHHLVHEGGWTVSWAEDGGPAFTAPDGKALVLGERREWDERVLTLLREWAETHDVRQGPDNLPEWDGLRPDYDWIVSALIRAN